MPLKRRLFCTLLALSVSAAALGTGDFIDSAALHQAGLVKYWQIGLPLAPEQHLADCYLVDDQIYAATQDGFVYALHAQTGTIRWVKQVTRAGYRVRRPCHVGGLTIFVTPSAIIQYDRHSGRPVRMMETRFPTGSPPVSDGARIYLGGIDQKIYAFFPDQDFELWKARANGAITSRPALFGDHLFFAGEDGRVFACVAANKSFYWRTGGMGSITADLAADENGVYVATLDNALILLDPTLGGRRWRTRFTGALYEPPVITPATAFQYCAEDGVVAINTGTIGVEQRVRWTLPRGRQALTVEDKLVYLLSSDESLIVVGLDDGHLVHTIPAAGFTIPMASPGELALYIASKDGRIFCARKRGVPAVRADDVRAALNSPEDGEGAALATTDERTAAPAAGEDQLESKRPGPPVGGKSKVSKEYTGD